MEYGRDALKMTQMDLKKTKGIWLMNGKPRPFWKFWIKKKMYKLQSLETNTSNLENRNNFYRLMKT